MSPDQLPPAVSAHKGLRGQILVELKRTQPLTSKELSALFGVSATAIRRHLKELEAEGVVSYGREQRGQGAPTFAYRLTANGEALFPKRYEEALTGFLAFVAKNQGREEVGRFFTERFRQQADALRVQLVDADLEQRVQTVVDLLSRQGFMADWSVEKGTLNIAEHNCAVQAVAEQYPEICEAEVEFLKEVLGADVVRRTHITAGCNACEYAINHQAPVTLLGSPSPVRERGPGGEARIA